MQMPLKTTQAIALESSALTSSDGMTVEIAVARILAGEEFAATDFANPDFRYEVAHTLMKAGVFESVVEAQNFISVLSAKSAGQPLAAEMDAWLREHRALIAQARKVAERAARAQEEQAALNKARLEVSRAEAALDFEKQRAERYAPVKENGERNYLEQYAGVQSRPDVLAIAFVSNWLAELELGRLTREVVIPELERRLVAARSHLDDLLQRTPQE